MKFLRNIAGQTGRDMIRNGISSDKVRIQNLFIETRGMITSGWPRRENG
jgi:hypothetical protein